MSYLLSTAQLVRGQSLKRTKKQETNHLRPTTLLRFSTRLGKAKAATVVALLGSGAAESTVTAKLAKNLRVRKPAGAPKTWSTPSGGVSTNVKAKSQFTVPELHGDRLTEWDFHVTPQLGSHDLTTGRDTLEFLGVDTRFSNQVIEWDGATLPLV